MFLTIFPFSGLKGVQKTSYWYNPSIHSISYPTIHHAYWVTIYFKCALVVMTYRKVPFIHLWCIRVSMAIHFPSRSIGIEIWMMFSWIKLRLFEIETVISVSILHPGF